MSDGIGGRCALYVVGGKFDDFGFTASRIETTVQTSRYGYRLYVYVLMFVCSGGSISR